MLPTAPSDTVVVTAVVQLSDAVAVPNDAVIVAVDGLHPNAVDEVGVTEMTGGV